MKFREFEMNPNLFVRLMDIMSMVCVRLINLITHLVEPGNIKSSNKT
jgi:hypothetical protein